MILRVVLADAGWLFVALGLALNVRRSPWLTRILWVLVGYVALELVAHKLMENTVARFM